jgi:hypothetical protein
MSVEPKPSDNLRQLKELMLGDEQRDLAELRARLDALEAESVERLARDLAAALHRRRRGGAPMDEEWVEALQPGTEGAIQRSVSEDKSRLAKALFPIMGPAIRSYVVDLFRGMVEELNETIRNTTSTERMRWRMQARLAGKSYSEYVLLKTRSYRIEEVFLMQRETGLLLLHAAVNPDDEADVEADLMSGMLTAIRSFVRDSFAPGQERDEETHELDSFTFGEREVLMEVGPSMLLAAVAHGVPPAAVRDELKGILEDLHAELQGRLNGFLGDTRLMESARPTLRRALLENRAAAAGGGMWRAWVFLGLVAAACGAWWYVGAREQGRWDRFEAALRAEPGIVVTAVEDAGWWRKRLVRGVRDPLAAEPAAVATAAGIGPEKTAFDFDLMASLEPAFAEKRAATAEERQQALLASLEKLSRDLETTASRDGLEGLGRRVDETLAALKASAATAETKDRQMLEALVRSQFGDVPGLEISVTGEAVRFAGTVAEPYHASVLARAKPLESLATIDVSALVNGTLTRLATLETEIAAVRLLYSDGALNNADDAIVARLAGHLRELDTLAAAAGRHYRFVVESHPLIGTLREGNRPIERQRATQVRDRLIANGIAGERIEIRLSEDLNLAGQGVGVQLTRDDGEEARPQ